MVERRGGRGDTPSTQHTYTPPPTFSLPLWMRPFLDVAVGALVVDTGTALILQATGAGGERVREWYRTLRVGAYAMDVLSLVIGVYVATRAADGIWAQMAIAVGVQMAHDLAFGAFVRSDAARGPLFGLFRRYADEVGASILWADAAMMVATVLASRAVGLIPSASDCALVGAIAAYAGLLTVYSFQ